jgi:hypothetical protein
VPRGGVPQLSKSKGLQGSGTQQCSTLSLGFLPEVSHQEENSDGGISCAIRLYIEPLSIGARGPRCRVSLGSPTGPILVKASTEPSLAGARALQARGITGNVELWDNERPFPRTRGRIEELSKWREQRIPDLRPIRAHSRYRVQATMGQTQTSAANTA